MNTIHGRVDIIRGKISWEWECEVESAASSSIEWMATTLLDMANMNTSQSYNRIILKLTICKWKRE